MAIQLLLQIQYEVYKAMQINRKTTKIYKRGNLQMDGDWEDEFTHYCVKRRIKDKHEGWSIQGYTLKK